MWNKTNDKMTHLIAIAFDDKSIADRALDDVNALEEEEILRVADACVVEHKPNGKVKLHQTLNPAAPLMANGMFWGLLVGLLFGIPLVGGLAGAAVGGVSGLVTDIGVNDNFMKRLGQTLKPGGAALFILVREGNFERALERIRTWPGEVLHTSLSRDVEAQLQATLADRRPAEEHPLWGPMVDRVDDAAEKQAV